MYCKQCKLEFSSVQDEGAYKSPSCKKSIKFDMWFEAHIKCKGFHPLAPKLYKQIKEDFDNDLKEWEKLGE